LGVAEDDDDAADAILIIFTYHLRHRTRQRSTVILLVLSRR
jgi:hypothetical protein